MEDFLQLPRGPVVGGKHTTCHSFGTGWHAPFIRFKSVRIEDGDLHKITDLFIEVFSGGLARGTIILLGSGTSMLHKESSGYVFD